MGTKLSNQAGVTLPGNWKLPALGTIGTIQNTNEKVNGYLSSDNRFAGGSLVLFEALNTTDKGQQWERIPDGTSGYFTLKKPHYSLFLANKQATSQFYLQGMFHFHRIGPEHFSSSWWLLKRWCFKDRVSDL